MLPHALHHAHTPRMHHADGAKGTGHVPAADRQGENVCTQSPDSPQPRLLPITGTHIAGAKDDPQLHLTAALGLFVTLNSDPISSVTKSMVAPLTRSRLISSTTQALPLCVKILRQSRGMHSDRHAMPLPAQQPEFRHSTGRHRKGRDMQGIGQRNGAKWGALRELLGNLAVMDGEPLET